MIPKFLSRSMLILREQSIQFVLNCLFLQFCAGAKRCGSQLMLALNESSYSAGSRRLATRFAVTAGAKGLARAGVMDVWFCALRAQGGPAVFGEYWPLRGGGRVQNPARRDRRKSLYPSPDQDQGSP